MCFKDSSNNEPLDLKLAEWQTGRTLIQNLGYLQMKGLQMEVSGFRSSHVQWQRDISKYTIYRTAKEKQKM